MTLSRFLFSSISVTILQAFVILYAARSLGVEGFAQFQLFLNLVVFVATLSSLKLEESLYRGKQALEFALLYICLSLIFAVSSFVYVTSQLETYKFIEDLEELFLLSTIVQSLVLYIGHALLSQMIFKGYLQLRLVAATTMLVSFVAGELLGYSPLLSIPISSFLASISVLIFYRDNLLIMFRSTALSFRNFLCVNTDLIKVNFPMSLISVGMVFILPIYVSETYGLVWAGLYLFADKMTDVPVNVLGNSVSKYVYSSGANKERAELIAYVHKVIAISIIFCVFSIILVAVLDILIRGYDSLIHELVGDWSNIQDFLFLLAVTKLTKLSNMPTANVLTLVRKQIFSFWYMLLFFLIRLLVMIAGIQDFLVFVLYWTLISIVYYLGHQLLVLRVLRITKENKE